MRNSMEFVDVCMCMGKLLGSNHEWKLGVMLRARSSQLYGSLGLK